MNYQKKRHKFNLNRILMCLFFVPVFCTAQTVGDFRSTIAGGNWATPSTWQTYNGTIWAVSTTYPGQNAGNNAVNIQAGSTVSIPNTGITTNSMGTLTINGKLTLTGSNSIPDFYLNTSLIRITPNLTPYATIDFSGKCVLSLPPDAVIEVRTGGLSGSANNNQEIHIGIYKFAVGNGGVGIVFTFDELMAAGGTLNAIATAPPSSCLGQQIQMTGNYSGAIGTPVTYNWTNTGPAPLNFTPNSTAKNPTVVPSAAGSYTISLTVSTNKGITLYNNTEKLTLVVAPISSTTNVAICQGDTYLFDGKTYGVTGTYASNLYKSVVTGCDSTAYLNLTVIQNSNTIIKDSICEGETYVYNGIPYQLQGDYLVSTSSGCSNTILSLKVKKTSHFEFNDSICEGNVYNFNGGSYISSGNYIAHLTNKVGCDSIVTLNLTVNPIPTVTNASLTETICSGTSTTLVTLTSDVAFTTFAWTASTDSGITGFTTSGTNTIPAQALTNPSSTTAGKVTYVISPTANGCTGAAVNYEVTVHPNPIISDIYHQ